jgi:hypothetical protein
MHFQKTEPEIEGRETSLDHAAHGVGPPATARLPSGVSEALADPIVKALMAADRVDPKDIAELLQRTAARLTRGFVLPLAVVAGLSAPPHLACGEPDRAAAVL